MVLSLSKAQISWWLDVLHRLGIKVLSVVLCQTTPVPLPKHLLDYGRDRRRREIKGSEEGREKRGASLTQKRG